MSDFEAPWMDHRDELLERVVRRARVWRRRRRLGVTGAALAVVLALGGGLYLPGRGPSTLHVANPDHESTTAPQPPLPAGVLLVGDQVMLGAKAALEHAIPDATVDAAVSRQLDDAVPMLTTHEQHGVLPPTIVIALGTNGPSEGDVFDRVTTEFRAIMNLVGPETTVYFVSVKVPRPWETAVNDGLYSEAGDHPNAHVLAWHDFSASHTDWFLADGIHLDPAGQVAYADFIRDGIRAPDATYSDPLAGRAVPTHGFVVTDDAKTGADQRSSSFTMTLYDDAGNVLGELPRATISNDVLNTELHVLVVTDTGIHLEPAPLVTRSDLASGCIQTETNEALAVALCGTGSGVNLLGNRILVNRGSGWSQLIATPPVQGGSPLVGHWAWAAPSPDGRWLLGAWSAECEVPMALFVSAADGSVRAVTGEAGTAWRGAPESGALGWTADGSAMAVFGGETACGGAAPVPRGIYLVSPETGSRRLLLALTPSQAVLTWSSVDDQRALPPVAGSPLRVDLDGDGRADQLRIAAAGGGQSPMTAALANGRVVSGTLPSSSAVRILGTADIAGDGRHEVFVRNGGETWTTGEIVMLDGNQLIAVPGAGDAMFPLGWGQHSNADPRGTADVACRAVDGHPSLVITTSSVAAGASSRDWRRSVYTLDGVKFVLQRQDTGALATTAAPPADLPLANRLDCGDAHG